MLLQIIAMSFLSDNIRYLRSQLKLSQQKVADALMITRGRYAKYEDGASEPPIELLLKLSRYYHVSIDLLLSVDLRRIPLKQIMELPDNRILLPISVDKEGENRIEIIPHKATMGYLDGYSDPEYIEKLQTIALPFLGVGKYRAFPADGASMPPHKDNSYIIGKYIDNLADLKTGRTYVFVTRSEGITYKRLLKVKTEAVEISSDNVFYKPYDIQLSDILEIWQYVSSIATEEFSKDDFQLDNIAIIRMLQELKDEVRGLKGNSVTTNNI